MADKRISSGARRVRIGDDDARVAQWCASLSRGFSANKLIFLAREFRDLNPIEYLVQIECLVRTVQVLIAGRVISCPQVSIGTLRGLDLGPCIGCILGSVRLDDSGIS